MYFLCFLPSKPLSMEHSSNLEKEIAIRGFKNDQLVSLPK